MKEGLHPPYFTDATITCAGCNTTYQIGSTVAKLQVELCSNCHPFYTGKQKLVDTAGRVDRFRARQAKAVAGKPTSPAVESAVRKPSSDETEQTELDNTVTPEDRLRQMKKTLEQDAQQ